MTTLDLLRRDLAPVLPEAWQAIDAEAKRVLALNLAGRKLVDFSGPHGWKHAAVNTGRIEMLEGRDPVEGVCAGVRTVQPLVELRIPFTIAQMELDVMARGATDPDLEPVVTASERIALAEDIAIFNGYEPGKIRGILPSSPHAPLTIKSPAEWPRIVVHGREVLRTAGINGPYALVLGPDAYDELSAAAEDGYPIRKRIEGKLLDGPIVWAPAVGCGLLISLRGGDYELTVGQDLSIGYAHHDRDRVELYLTESFTFRVLEPAAAIGIRREGR
jgi:uncharacterized linocin/CFP29 family protein